MSVVAQVLAWLLLAAFFVAVVCNAAGPKSDEERARDDAEQMEALTRGPGYEEHA